jgi:hypothetical protein
MKRFLMTVALTCLLSSSALAGDVPTVGTPQPPNQTTATPISTGDTPSVLGDMSTDGSADQISGEALSALLAVLSLLAV